MFFKTIISLFFIISLLSCSEQDDLDIIQKLDRKKIENRMVIKAYNDFISRFKNKNEAVLVSFKVLKINDSPRKNLHPCLIIFTYSYNRKLTFSKYYSETNKLIRLGHNINLRNSSDFMDLLIIAKKRMTKHQKEEFLEDYEYYANQYYLIENDFYNWGRFMPSVFMYDTINSKQKLIPTKYNEKYLPQKAENLGFLFRIGDLPNDMLCYIIYLYNENSRMIPYLEVYDFYNKKMFRRKLFDYQFIEKSDLNSCRFYRKEKYLVFENVTNINGYLTIVKKDSFDFMNQYQKLINEK